MEPKTNHSWRLREDTETIIAVAKEEEVEVAKEETSHKEISLKEEKDNRNKTTDSLKLISSKHLYKKKLT